MPTCEICNLPVREGLRVCSGLSPCWYALERRREKRPVICCEKCGVAVGHSLTVAPSIEDALRRADVAERRADAALAAADATKRHMGRISCGQCGADLGPDSVLTALTEALDRETAAKHALASAKATIAHLEMRLKRETENTCAALEQSNRLLDELREEWIVCRICRATVETDCDVWKACPTCHEGWTERIGEPEPVCPACGGTLPAPSACPKCGERWLFHTRETRGPCPRCGFQMPSQKTQ